MLLKGEELAICVIKGLLTSNGNQHVIQIVFNRESQENKNRIRLVTGDRGHNQRIVCYLIDGFRKICYLFDNWNN